MSLIGKKDVSLLLNAGFSEEELGLVEGGMKGVEVYQTPGDYFAKELVENACEQGLCSLYDEFIPTDKSYKLPYDTSHKGLYEGQEYDGNDDFLEGIPVNCTEQVRWLNTIKLGKMTVWQRRNKKGIFEWQVKNLSVVIPDDDKERYNSLIKEYQRELWISYARDEWKKLWRACAMSLRYFVIEEIIKITTRKGFELNLMVISADSIRKMGYDNLPPEARWITMVFFEKDNHRT